MRVHLLRFDLTDGWRKTMYVYVFDTRLYIFCEKVSQKWAQVCFFLIRHDARVLLSRGENNIGENNLTRWKSSVQGRLEYGHGSILYTNRNTFER